MSDNENPFGDRLTDELTPKDISLAFRLLMTVIVTGCIAGLVLLWSFYRRSGSLLNYLSDAFFVAGVLTTGLGILSVVKKSGFFDMYQFGFRQLGQIIVLAVKMDREKTIDKDFDAFRKEKRRKRVSRWHWVFVGFVYIAVGIIISFWL